MPIQSGTVIDDATNNTTTVATGIGPQSVAVNPMTSKAREPHDEQGLRG